MNCIYEQVLTTAAKKRDAEKLSNVLLERRLAACVQIMPVESRYRWKGRIEKGREYLCVIKSRRALYREIERIVKENNPYETPEIISVPISKGSKDYLNWLDAETCRK